jgi:hypothetical protein
VLQLEAKTFEALNNIKKADRKNPIRKIVSVAFFALIGASASMAIYFTKYAISLL